jgi:hypothetical protein
MVRRSFNGFGEVRVEIDFNFRIRMDMKEDLDLMIS